MRNLPSIAAAGLCLAAAATAQVPAGYAGTPWHDTIQTVPGRLEPERYDEGSTGVTWFDTGPKIGAYAVRNPTGVDLDPVKAADQTVPGSTVKHTAGGIYWGWLENGEWLKMTVDVKQAGTYAIHAMVGTAMNGTSFRVDALRGTDSVSSGTLTLPFTGNPCPVECYHYWNYAKDLGTITLKAGIQVIRMQIVKSGYNIEFVELVAAGTGARKPSRIAMPRPGGARVDAQGRAADPASPRRAFAR